MKILLVIFFLVISNDTYSQKVTYSVNQKVTLTLKPAINIDKQTIIKKTTLNNSIFYTAGNNKWIIQKNNFNYFSVADKKEALSNRQGKTLDNHSIYTITTI